MGRTVSESGRPAHSASFPLIGAFLLAGALAIAAPTASAGDWVITPSLELAETVTDNVNLASDANADSEFITEITPGIAIEGQSARLRGFAEYQLQNLIYLSESDRSTTNHQFIGSGTAEVRESSIFLEADALVTQVLVDPATFAYDSISTVNRTDVYSLRLSPYYVHDFGGAANLHARYTNGITRYDSSASDTDLNQVDVSLTSGRRFTRLEWGANYYAADYDQERRTPTSGDAEHRVTTVEGSYWLTPHFALIGQAGDEFHEYEVPTRGVNNGTYSAAGVRWQPNPRTRISTLYGDRYQSATLDWNPTRRTSVFVEWRDTAVGVNVGEAWNADISLYTRSTRWGARYVEESGVTQQLDFIGQSFAFLRSDAEGRILELRPEPFEGMTGGFFITQDTFGLTNEVFLRERAEVYMILDRPRTEGSVRIYDEERTYLTSGDVESVRGLSSYGSWLFGRRTSWIGSFDFARRELRLPAGVEDDLWRVETGLQRQLGPNSEGALTVGHGERESNLSTRDYTENRMTLWVRLQF